MEHAMACAERLRCDRVELDVAGFNDAAVSFYEKLGYAPWQYRMYKRVGPTG
jgi:ribosomal protein S18 acetylase RimI-like enzyme